ncbi:hypothetical protein [Pantoea septica]|uniref:hypothetical protein n=1 Tax=Pantoea septica TaxID=472695 RepID=UPI00289D7E57|nr:hypothetical protein [Pantoea septica]
MERWELEYSLYLSHYKEKMHATLTRRIDKVINFALLITGSAVFADFGGNMFFGLVVAALSALSYVGEFSKSSTEASRLAKEYHQIIIAKDSLSDEELSKVFQDLNKSDSPVWNCLSAAARNRTKLALYGRNQADLEKYSWFDAVMSWLAGDKP